MASAEITTTAPPKPSGRMREHVKDDTAENGYRYAGAEIPFDPADVWNLPDDPKAAAYPVGSEQRTKVDAFNRAYSDILRLLQKTFDGNPQQISESLFSMGLLRRVGTQVVSTTDPDTGKQLGLTFEYVPAETT